MHGELAQLVALAAHGSTFLARPAGTEPPQVYDEDVVKWADAKTPAFPDEEDYHDPVGGSYAGAWLASEMTADPLEPIA